MESDLEQFCCSSHQSALLRDVLHAIGAWRARWEALLPQPLLRELCVLESRGRSLLEECCCSRNDWLMKALAKGVSQAEFRAVFHGLHYSLRTFEAFIMRADQALISEETQTLAEFLEHSRSRFRAVVNKDFEQLLREDALRRAAAGGLLQQAINKAPRLQDEDEDEDEPDEVRICKGLLQWQFADDQELEALRRESRTYSMMVSALNDCEDEEEQVSNCKQFLQIFRDFDKEEVRLGKYLLQRLRSVDKEDVYQFVYAGRLSYIIEEEEEGEKLRRRHIGALGVASKAAWRGLNVVVKEYDNPAGAHDLHTVLHNMVSVDDHVNVLQVIGYHMKLSDDQHAHGIKKNVCPCLVTERMEGNLEEFIRRLQFQQAGGSAAAAGAPVMIPLAISLEILLQIASAMEHLHEEAKIVHGNLKPSNILLNRWPSISVVEGERRHDFTVKLADYGFPRIQFVAAAQSLGSGSAQYADIAPAQFSCRRASMLQTALFTAPEVMRAACSSSSSSTITSSQSSKLQRKDKLADIFSFGLICYQILSGVDSSQLAAARELPADNHVLSRCPSALVYLVQKCRSYEARKRPSSFPEIIRCLALLKAFMLCSPKKLEEYHTMPKQFYGQLDRLCFHQDIFDAVLERLQ